MTMTLCYKNITLERVETSVSVRERVRETGRRKQTAVTQPEATRWPLSDVLDYSDNYNSRLIVSAVGTRVYIIS